MSLPPAEIAAFRGVDEALGERRVRLIFLPVRGFEYTISEFHDLYKHARGLIDHDEASTLHHEAASPKRLNTMHRGG
jgi:hypothetical protein